MRSGAVINDPDGRRVVRGSRWRNSPTLLSASLHGWFLRERSMNSSTTELRVLCIVGQHSAFRRSFRDALPASGKAMNASGIALVANRVRWLRRMTFEPETSHQAPTDIYSCVTAFTFSAMAIAKAESVRQHASRFSASARTTRCGTRQRRARKGTSRKAVVSR